MTLDKDLQRQIREGNAERRRLRGIDGGGESSDPPAAARMTLSRIVELLLTRSGGERSSVSLTRNAKGETQIEVTVRTGDDGDVLTVLDAEARATEVYERLRANYPLASGYVGAHEARDAEKPQEGQNDGRQT